MSELTLDYINRKDQRLFTFKYDKEHFSSEKLSVHEYSDGIIIPNINDNGGVYYSGKFIYNTALHRTWVSSFPEEVKAEQYEQNEVVYLGMFHDIWGHCITDNLKHLWFLNSPDFSYLTKLKFVFCSVNDDFSFSQNFKELLLILGINSENLIRITKPTRFSKVYIPDECFFYNPVSECYQYTNEYVSMINKICPPLPFNESNEKLYFSRTAIKNHKDVGEQKVERFFLSNGYKIVHPELLSLSETLSLLQKCSSFASTEGSISHNSIFCPEESQIIILRKSNGNFNSYQLALNSIKKQKIVFIDCSKSPFMNKTKPWTGPFFLFVSKNLTSFFNAPRMIFPLLTYVTDYYLYWLLRRIKHIFIGKKND